MRPIIKPGLRRLWRDQTTLQLGIDAGRAVVLSGMAAGTSGALELLDGTRSRGQLMSELPAPARELVTLLDASGVLDDASPGSGPATEAQPALERDRLRPDLASLSLLERGPSSARTTLDARRGAIVRVVGSGRVGAHVAALLAAAGVGTVVVDDAGIARPADVAPGGLCLDDVGRPRSVAAGRSIARVCRPSVPRRRPATPVRPDLVVIAPPGLPVADPDEAVELERARIPHLLAGVRETTGVVGPLVTPGASSCLSCQHLHRTDRDPAWPLLAAQLTRRPETGVDACDIALAALVSALAAMQALAFLDAGAGPPGAGPSGSAGVESPASVGGTLEITLPSWRIRRRTWPIHPECACAAAQVAAGEPDPAG